MEHTTENTTKPTRKNVSRPTMKSVFNGLKKAMWQVETFTDNPDHGYSEAEREQLGKCRDSLDKVWATLTEVDGQLNPQMREACKDLIL